MTKGTTNAKAKRAVSTGVKATKRTPTSKARSGAKASTRSTGRGAGRNNVESVSRSAVKRQATQRTVQAEPKSVYKAEFGRVSDDMEFNRSEQFYVRVVIGGVIATAVVVGIAIGFIMGKVV